MTPFEKFFKNKKTDDSSPSPASQGSSPSSVLIHQLLSPHAVVITEHPGKKSEFLKELVKLIADEHADVPRERAYQAVMEREKVTSTFMDTGVGVPHARLPKIDRLYAALGILKKGFLDQEGSPTSIVFLFLSPDGEFTTHLQILSRASWLFQNAHLREKLPASENVEDVLRLIKETEESSTHGPKA